jgi:cyclopropane-fatty-acyl-phospholipid synthase
MLKERPSSETNHLWVIQPDERSNYYSDPDGRFAVVADGDTDVHQFLRMDPYSAAKAFVDGKIDIRGDLFSAIRFFSSQPHFGIRQLLLSTGLRLRRLTNGLSIGNKRTAAHNNIQFHYNRSNEFYGQFLDSRLLYSAAHFSYPEQSLDEAQTEKLELICRTLVLHSDERFLDVGCGWGGLITYAASHFGVAAEGCTLSERQLEFANEAARRENVEDQVTVHLRDYRDLDGRFNKVASVGMFEHVGRSRLAGYFKKVHALLDRRGLFLNRGVVRPQGVSDDLETLFLQKNVFPGGELVHLDDVVREGERAGFEVVAMEDFRLNYALTCRAWTRNLEKRADVCRGLVGDATYRTWLLYLAASAVSFEDGLTGAAQVLFARC